MTTAKHGSEGETSKATKQSGEHEGRNAQGVEAAKQSGERERGDTAKHGGEGDR